MLAVAVVVVATHTGTTRSGAMLLSVPVPVKSRSNAPSSAFLRAARTSLRDGRVPYEARPLTRPRTFSRTSLAEADSAARARTKAVATAVRMMGTGRARGAGAVRASLCNTFGWGERRIVVLFRGVPLVRRQRSFL